MKSSKGLPCWSNDNLHISCGWYGMKKRRCKERWIFTFGVIEKMQLPWSMNKANTRVVLVSKEAEHWGFGPGFKEHNLELNNVEIAICLLWTHYSRKCYHLNLDSHSRGIQDCSFIWFNSSNWMKTRHLYNKGTNIYILQMSTQWQ